MMMMMLMMIILLLATTRLPYGQHGTVCQVLLPTCDAHADIRRIYIRQVAPRLQKSHFSLITD